MQRTAKQTESNPKIQFGIASIALPMFSAIIYLRHLFSAATEQDVLKLGAEE